MATVATLARCTAVLAVVPARTLVGARLSEWIRTARDSNRPVILIPHDRQSIAADGTTDESQRPIDATLTGLPIVEETGLNGGDAIDDKALWLSLCSLIPHRRHGGQSVGHIEGSTPLAWHALAFSTLLADAVGRLDHQRAAALVREFSRYCQSVDRPYSAAEAKNDLSVLRKKRMFPLMRDYAAAALNTGTSTFQVQRQYAQALIELADFDTAREVLGKLIASTPKGDEEEYEARGLLGRLYKQLYVNAPDAPGSVATLRRAIETYGDAFNESAQSVWHGVNTATLMLRAARDLGGEDFREGPRTLAKKILTTLREREEKAAKGGQLSAWDLATRIEALLLIDDIDGANRSLDEYLRHPDMDAFEVSSTYRQFDEVLQLGRDARTRPLLERLWHAVRRHRTSGLIAADDEPARSDAAGPRHRLLLGISDPSWNRSDIPDLTIHARMGNVLSISGTDRTMQALLKDPLVISLEESRPAGPPDCAPSLAFINVPAGLQFNGVTGPYTEKGEHALVAIIDDGIDILHAAFLDDAGQSRIIGIWDQDDASGAPPAGFDFGTFYDEARIASLVAERSKPSPTVPPRLRNPASHGTHVGSIAAGRPVEGRFLGGVAQQAPLLVVISGGSDAIGYSETHVAALAFIDRVARERNLPVAVNVSQGMNAGAHDGKSLVEVAFDQFSKGGREPGRVVVKSAGNERDRRGHAEMRLLTEEQSEFTWTCRKEPWHMDRLELWWNSANEYAFRLRSPAGDHSEWLTSEEPTLKGVVEDVKFKMEFVRNHVDNGDSRLTLELGSRFTEQPPLREWALEVRAVAVRGDDDTVHAWIERRNGAPSEFVSTNATERMTLSIPGTASSVITVAAVVAAIPIVVGKFSSHGPTRDDRKKPDVCAPGVNVVAARAGTLDDVWPLDGTSMAAPHVTGAIALALSKRQRAGQDWPSATQIGALLRQTTRNPSGKWTPGQGFGVIDVSKFLQAF